MAIKTFAIADWLMDILLFGEIVVAFRAGVLDRLLQQALEICRVWRVTVQTVARLNRLMLVLHVRQRIVVARQAKVVALGDQQVLVWRVVGVMATDAIAFIHRLMFDLAGQKGFLEFLVTIETDLSRLSPHRVGKFRFMTRSAVALREGRVHDVFRPLRLHRNLNRNICIQGLARARHHR